MDKQALKRAAAIKALEFVRPNMRLGIGTGSTAEEFIRLLADKIRNGLNIIGVPTSERSRILCKELGIALTDLDFVSHLDMTVDGADELDSQLRLIKGGGGALLREKITAYASAKMLVIADYSKLVTKLGAFPLPIEVNIFGLAATKQAIEQKATALGLKGILHLRLGEDKTKPFITDGGHYILDAHFGVISAPEKLAVALCEVPGVVEHGLFFHPDCCVLLAQENGTIRQIDKK